MQWVWGMQVQETTAACGVFRRAFSLCFFPICFAQFSFSVVLCVLLHYRYLVQCFLPSSRSLWFSVFCTVFFFYCSLFSALFSFPMVLCFVLCSLSIVFCFLFFFCTVSLYGSLLSVLFCFSMVLCFLDGSQFSVLYFSIYIAQ